MEFKVVENVMWKWTGASHLAQKWEENCQIQDA